MSDLEYGEKYKVFEKELLAGNITSSNNSYGYSNLFISINGYMTNRNIDEELIENYIGNVSTVLSNILNCKSVEDELGYFKIDNFSSITYHNNDNLLIYYPYVILSDEDYKIVSEKLLTLKYSNTSSVQLVHANFIPNPNHGWELLYYKNRSGYTVEFENISTDNLKEYIESFEIYPEITGFLFFEDSYFSISSSIALDIPDENYFINNSSSSMDRLHKYLAMIANVSLSKSQNIIILRSIVGTIQSDSLNNIIDISREILMKYDMYNSIKSFNGIPFDDLVRLIYKRANYYDYKTVRYLLSVLDVQNYNELVLDRILKYMSKYPMGKGGKMGCTDIAKMIYYRVRNTYCGVSSMNGKDARIRFFNKTIGIWTKGGAYQRLAKEIQSFREFLNSVQLRKRIVDKDDYDTLIIKLSNLNIQLGGSNTQILHALGNMMIDENFDTNDEGAIKTMNFCGLCVDLTFDKYYTRCAVPQDYFINYSLYRFREMDWNNSNVRMFMKYMKQMWKDDEYVEYVLKVLSLAIISQNIEQIFPWISGAGDNSKTTFKILLQKIFGTYYHTVSSDHFFISGSGPTPALAAMDRKKLIILVEPSAGTKMDDSIFKIVSGSEDIHVRYCNENGKVLKFNCLVMGMANQIPHITASVATVKRQRVLNTMCTYIRKDDVNSQIKVPQTEEEQWKNGIFPIDLRFIENLIDMVPAAIWVLIQYAQKYLVEGIKTPNIVREFTSSYFMNTDNCYQFINNYVKVTGDPNDYIQLNIMYMDYYTWCEENKISRGKIKQQPEFMYDIKSKYNRGNELSGDGNYLYGYKNTYGENIKPQNKYAPIGFLGGYQNNGIEYTDQIPMNSIPMNSIPMNYE